MIASIIMHLIHDSLRQFTVCGEAHCTTTFVFKSGPTCNTLDDNNSLDTPASKDFNSLLRFSYSPLIGPTLLLCLVTRRAWKADHLTARTPYPFYQVPWMISYAASPAVVVVNLVQRLNARVLPTPAGLSRLGP
ncbi:hypothetical protein Hypma_012640 [Hypsizygus marmoreus]|uniref:Uncharacterized protein n=1 Tax=Hypsizygus marmoreus TaxID=39966 RepID=A0A369JII5_HYPMA|nr:hypothetical protein Hypma_012640 [Hypsizygus marmoreus]